MDDMLNQHHEQAHNQMVQDEFNNQHQRFMDETDRQFMEQANPDDIDMYLESLKQNPISKLWLAIACVCLSIIFIISLFIVLLLFKQNLIVYLNL
ncbi:hypothetical protein LZ480_10975 [Solibacillus sp. MA9]|uniref:Uncharacterized protein n=1 Tax=Solibacillus palustris TaxID=2908203 RepID=A0ABS9UDK6_9BACL|nr:hypothetical protein [Solibacillus sp. MA9]MCH7322414.1 hypothetical protein [Solibacillus sp. MA9]